MNLQQILDHIYSRVNKDQSGNTYNLNRYNNDLLVANLEMFSYYYGLPQGYAPGAPFPAVSAEITQKVTDSLRHLVVNMGGDGPNDPGPLVLTNGVAIIPSDYVHYDYMNYTYISSACGNGKTKYPPITVLTGADWSTRVNSEILNFKVEKYPYCNFQKDYIQFRPKTIQYVNFAYWRSPKTPYYDYYKDANDNVVFMPTGTSHLLTAGETGSAGQTAGTSVVSTTVELEWPVDTHADFANIILGYVSDNLRSEFLKQSSEMRKSSGQ